MAPLHGDWGWNGLMTAATRHLGWRLVEVAREILRLSYGAARQGLRWWFWTNLPKDSEKTAFRTASVNRLSLLQI
jgi:predicted ATP-grasp superfamily ATP-dependent carboligase